MNLIVFRVQDAEGRGPYRPGLSHKWTDDDHWRNQSFFVEFGWSVEKVRTLWNRNESGGCGFRDLVGLHRWFGASECAKLDELGYSIVRMVADRIIAESRQQLVFARKKPLWVEYEMLPWSIAATQSIGTESAA